MTSLFNKRTALLPISAALALFAGFLSVQTASAQFGYRTGFESSEGYLPGTLSGSPSNTPSGTVLWDTSDPSTNPNPGTTGEFIGQADSVLNFSGNYMGAIGGRGAAVPGAQRISLFRDFSVAGITDQFTFDVDFAITTSSATYPGQDTFGWSLVNTANVEVFALTFVPAGSALNVFSSYLGQPATDTTKTIFRDANYHLTVVVAQTGEVSVAISGVVVPVQPGFVVANDLKRVAATQFVNAGGANSEGAFTGAGSNQMIFDNYAAVPEPSSIALLSVAGISGLVVMAKRRKALRQ